MRNMFTKKDLDANRALLNKTKNPYRIAEFLALDLALVCKGLEQGHLKNFRECQRLNNELDEAREELGQALAKAKEEVAGEVEGLRQKLAEAESSKAKAEEEVKELTKANRTLKKKLSRSRAKVNEARKEAEGSRSALEKKIADLSDELEKNKSELLEASSQAVEEYKDSDSFRLDVATRAIPAYLLGLKKYREVLSEQLPELDLFGLDALLPGSLPEGAEAEEEEDEEEEEEEAPAGDEGTAQGVAPVDPSQGEAEVEVPRPSDPEDGVTDLTLQPTDGDVDAEA